jgi:divalent metal cation (Fe/Co/Zn/Cd) transporter
MGYDLRFLDPVGTVVVCVMLLQAAWAVAEPALAALLDSSADRRLCSDIRKTTLRTPGVLDAHRIRTRIICSNAVAVDLHIKVDRNLTVERGHQIAADVKYRILALNSSTAMAASPVDVLVHVEPGDPSDFPSPSPCGDTLVDWRPRR